ncbi:MAG: ribosome recycling factor [Lewinellaceae bacterium]|nr:ribosome recycling factor [Lewinellaceae bacterium]
MVNHAEDIKQLMIETTDSMKQAIKHLEQELLNVRTGKANAGLVAGIMVSYYGNPTPLNQVGNVSNQDARTLIIQPWEKKMIAPIEKAIFEANLGVTPQNDGEVIRISIPPLTEERRKDLVKQAKTLGEDAKISIRSARQKAKDAIKKSVKDGYPEDMGHDRENEVQKLTDEHNKHVDEMFAAKEIDIMTV